MRNEDLTKTVLFKDIAKYLAKEFDVGEDVAMNFLALHAEKVWNATRDCPPGQNSFPHALRDYWRSLIA